MLKLRAIDDTALLTPSGIGVAAPIFLASLRKPGGGPGREGTPGGEDEVLGRRVMARQLLAFDTEHLDRHATMGGDAVAQRLARTLRETDRHVVLARRCEQPLRQFRRQVVGDDELPDHARGALGVAGADGMAFALLDGLAFLRHAFDDAVDRRLLFGFGRLDVVPIAQVGHGDPQRVGVNENSWVRIEGGAPGVNHCVSWMWLAVT